MTTNKSPLWGFLILYFLAWVPAGTGQQSSSAADPWPPISKEELALKDNPALPNSPAMILYREVYADDVQSFRSEYYRVKIFNESGKKYGDIKILYLANQTDVQDIRARTIRADGTVVDFHGEMSEATVVKARRFRYQQITLSLPDVQVGSIIEYSYKFHRHQKAPDVLRNPENYIPQGFFSYPTASWTLQDELYTSHASFILRPLPKAHLVWSTLNVPSTTAPTLQPNGTYRLELHNIPAFQPEDFMPPEDFLKPRVEFVYTIGWGNAQSFWADQGRFASDSYKKFIEPSKVIEREANSIVSPGDSPQAKLRKIYARCQQIRNLGYERPRTEKEIKEEGLKDNKNSEDILKHGYAWGNEVNLFFVALTRAAGMDSSPILVATRDRDFFYKDILDAGQLDGMVVVVRLGSDRLYFDPATRPCPYELLPWSESGVKGVEVTPAGGQLISTPEPTSVNSVIERKASFVLDKDGDLSGKLAVEFRGQEALERRQTMWTEDDVARRQKLEDEVKTWLPEGATIELTKPPEWQQTTGTLRAEFNVKSSQSTTSIGKRILLPSGIFHPTRKYPLQNAVRAYPLYIEYPYQESDDITIELPAGYHAGHVPEPLLKTAQFGEYESQAQSLGSTLHLKRHLQMDSYYFNNQVYGDLKAFFAAGNARDEDPVILEPEAPAPPK